MGRFLNLPFIRKKPMGVNPWAHVRFSTSEKLDDVDSSSCRFEEPDFRLSYQLL